MEAPGSNEGAAVATPSSATGASGASAAGPRGRLPGSALAALAAAGVALVLAIATTIVVLGRSSSPAASGRVLIETTATAEAVLTLLDDGKLVLGAPSLTLLDPAALGLAPGDELVSLGGRPLRTALDVRSGLRPLLRAKVEALLLEIRRDGAPAVVRIAIVGDLAAAYSARLATRRASLSSSSSSSSDPDVAAIAAGVTKIDDEHVEITRAAADLLRADPTRLLGGARVVPSIANGAPNGVKLYAIRPSSLIAAIGLRNGDTIVAINDHELGSMDRLLDAYRELRDDPIYRLDLKRRGQDVALTITVR